SIDLGPASEFASSQPVHYASDDLYVVRLDDGGTHYVAFYDVVPNTYFGVERGCRITWQPDRKFQSNGKTYNGVFVGQCSGSVFAVDGTRLFGPAPHDLNQFFIIELPGQA